MLLASAHLTSRVGIDTKRNSFPKADHRGLRSKLSPSAIQLERKISDNEADPLATLRTGLKNDSLDLETTWVCLFTYRSSLNSLDGERRSAQIKADGVGGLTLDWLWKTEDRWAHVLSREILFFDTISYYLVAEGLEEYLLGIIKLDPPTGSHVHPSWRGIVLRSLIKAIVQLEPDHSADQAIKTFVKVHAEVMACKASKLKSGQSLSGDYSYVSISLLPASIELSGRLTTNAYHKTSAHLFRQLIAIVSKTFKPGRSPEFSFATMALFDPGSPNPDPSLAVLRRWEDEMNSSSELEVFPTKVQARKYIYLTCRRLESALSGYHRHQDVLWVEEFRKRHFTKAEHRFFDASEEDRDSWSIKVPAPSDGAGGQS